MSVTANDSVQVDAAVTRNECRVCEGERRYSPPEGPKRWGLGELHCTTCHGDHHLACAVCGACLPRRHRYDRRYCSTSCRVKAHEAREQARLERAIWEAEHPDEARRQVEELHRLETVFRAMGESGGYAREKRIRELQRRAEQCAGSSWHPETETLTDCGKPFGPGDVIYRRRDGSQLDPTTPVLPYCREHRCGSYHHNKDAAAGYYYPACVCEDDKWEHPDSCLGCGRLVSHPKHARWRQRRRDWAYMGEKMPGKPRVFCSGHCRGLVICAERKAKNAAGRHQERQCLACGVHLNGDRADARYCGAACRQKAYRRRTQEAVS